VIQFCEWDATTFPQGRYVPSSRSRLALVLQGFALDMHHLEIANLSTDNYR